MALNSQLSASAIVVAYSRTSRTSDDLTTRTKSTEWSSPRRDLTESRHVTAQRFQPFPAAAGLWLRVIHRVQVDYGRSTPDFDHHCELESGVGRHRHPGGRQPSSDCELLARPTWRRRPSAPLRSVDRTNTAVSTSETARCPADIPACFGCSTPVTRRGRERNQQRRIGHLPTT